jgi:hypothetical protein
MVDPGKIEKEVGVMAISLSAVSSQISVAAEPTCCRRAFRILLLFRIALLLAL